MIQEGFATKEKKSNFAINIYQKHATYQYSKNTEGHETAGTAFAVFPQ